MSTATTATPRPRLIPTRHPLPQRWWLDAVHAWKTWRAAAREHDELRSLEGLSRGTLCDIGLHDRVTQQPTVSLLDFERGRW